MKVNIFLKIFVPIILVLFIFITIFITCYFSIPQVKQWTDLNIFKVEQTAPPEDETLEELYKEITQLNENVNAMLRLLDEKDSQIQLMTSDLDKTYNEITALENELESLSQEQAKRIEELQNELEALKTKANNLEFNLTTLSQEITSLKNEVNNCKALITDLQTKLDDLENKIDYVVNSGVVPNGGGYGYEYRMYKSGKVEVTGWVEISKNETTTIYFKNFEMPSVYYRMATMGNRDDAEWTNSIYYTTITTTSVTVGNSGNTARFQFIILHLGLV